MSFTALRDFLPALAEGDTPEAAWPRVARGGVSFSDDLTLPRGRLGVRVRITDREGGGYVIDLRDSDPPPRDLDRFRLDPQHARTACLLALGHALGVPAHRSWESRVELLLDPNTWIGANEGATDPAALAFGMARTADAVLGALANAWPGRVGAGSCSLGAVVEFSEGAKIRITEVLPGGEGGRPDRAGTSAWAGLVLPTPWDDPPAVEGITLGGHMREGSGGTGKHDGGEGIVREYQLEHALTACVAFDRIKNPPHGIDRAGPPLGTEVVVHMPGSPAPRPLAPWERIELPAGARLVVRTCGGAGWGFPGYGDIEWDPSEWFGSSAKKPS